jgi:hypothetical protein
MKVLNIGRPKWVTIASVLMILFGFAEVLTGFTHNFLGIATPKINTFTYASAVIGTFYAAAGLLILTMRKWAAKLAIALLLADILGRIGLVVTGLYPTDSIKNTLAIVVGTMTVAIFAIGIAMHWKSFR